MDLQVIKGTNQRVKRRSNIKYVTVFVLILFKSNQLHWLEFLKRVLAPWVYRMGCSTFTIVCQFHVQNLWGCSSRSEVAACLQRHEVPPNIHFQDTSFFSLGVQWKHLSTPVLGVVYSGIESAHQFDPFAARNAAGDSWTQIRSGVREGGDKQFTHGIHQRWYLQFKKRNTNIFHNGKKPEM